MTTSTPTAILTSADLRDLRRADAICFDTGSHVQTESGSQMRAIIRGTDREGERTIVIPAGVARLQDYSGASGDYSAFHMAMVAQHDPIIATFVRLLKPGYAVEFQWTRNNASPITNEAGIVVDHFDVLIRDKNNGPAAMLRLHTFIGRDNSARMVKR